MAAFGSWYCEKCKERHFFRCPKEHTNGKDR